MIQFTQNGDHDVIFQDLNRAAGQEVEGGENVAAVDQSVSGRRVRGLEVHRQGPQAAFGGSLEHFAVVEEIIIEMKTDICLQALRKTFEYLWEGCWGGVESISARVKSIKSLREVIVNLQVRRILCSQGS